MVIMRNVLRNLALAPYFNPNQLPVAPQWSINVLFVLLFVAGLATLYYMLRKVAMRNQDAGGSSPKASAESIAAMSGVYSGCAVTCSSRDLNCVLSFSPNWFDVMDVASPSRQQEASTSGPPLQQQVGGKVHDQRDHD